MSESKHICGIGHGVACNACAEEENERLRVERWHATYNAALTGFIQANHARTDDIDASHYHEWAECQADTAHGELVKP